MQHLQQALLDEPVEYGRDAQLPPPAAAFGDLLPPHRLRLVAAREQWLADRRPVRRQVGRQFLHGHPVEAGAAPVLPYAFERCHDIGTLDHRLHQALVVS